MLLKHKNPQEEFAFSTEQILELIDLKKKRLAQNGLSHEAISHIKTEVKLLESYVNLSSALVRNTAIYYLNPDTKQEIIVDLEQQRREQENNPFFPFSKQNKKDKEYIRSMSISIAQTKWPELYNYDKDIVDESKFAD